MENSDNFDYDFDQSNFFYTEKFEISKFLICLFLVFIKGQFKFKYEKANKGENFDGLDLLTKLLTAPTNKKTSLLIEEISNEGT